MLLLTNIGQLLTLRGRAGPRRGKALAEIGFVKDGAVLCDEGIVIAAGKQREVLKHPAYKTNKRKARIFDCKGRLVTPGFADSHTHPAFIHPRLARTRQPGDHESNAEITVRMNEAAMKLCEPPTTDHAPRKPAWRDDAALLTWLASL